MILVSNISLYSSSHEKKKQPSSVLFMELNQIFFLSITFNTSKICG